MWTRAAIQRIPGCEVDLSDFAATRFPALPLSKEIADRNLISIEHFPPQPDASDEVLLTYVARGDQEALGHLFQRYGRLLRSVAARILGDGTEAEDLVQDLFLFIHRKSEMFDSSKSSARSWIIQMTYHRAISRRRYLVTRQFYSHQDVERVGEQVVGVATTENDYSAEAVLGRNGLEKVMEALTDDQRKTLRLHFFEGYTLAEISEKLGQPHGNVRHHYYRGLAQLRKQMSGSNVRVVERYGK
jgi:RNA polymerase sigma-70 factor (ECF subfamily)